MFRVNQQVRIIGENRYHSFPMGAVGTIVLKEYDTAAYKVLSDGRTQWIYPEDMIPYSFKDYTLCLK